MNRLQKTITAVRGLINRETAQKIETDFPATVEILGAARKIAYQYSTGYWSSDPGKAKATVTLTCEEAELLQEEDLMGKIPGATPITVTLSDEGFTGISSESPLAIRQKIRETARSRAWDKARWASPAPWSGKGFETKEIELGQELPVLPEPVRYGEYRELVFMAHPARKLEQYGKYTEQGQYVYAWRVSCVWYSSERDATTADTQATERWAKLRQEEQDRRILPELEEKATAARESLRSLESNQDFKDLDYDIRYAVRYHGSSPSDARTIREWTTKTDALRAQVEAKLAEIRKRKDDEETARRAAEQRAELARQELGKRLIQHYPSCPVCGKAIEPSRLEQEELAKGNGVDLCDCVRYSDSDAAQEFVASLEAGWMGETFECAGKDAAVLRRTTIGGKTLTQVLCFHKWGAWNLWMKVCPEHLGAEGQWTTEDVWRKPTSDEVHLAQLRRQRETYASEVERAEEEREAGQALLLSFRKGQNPKTGEEQWVSGSNKSAVKYIVDRFYRGQIEEGRQYYCREVRDLVSTPTFRLVVVCPFLEAGLNLDEEIAKLEGKPESAAIETPMVETTAAPTTAATASEPAALFAHTGKRYYRCPQCGKDAARLESGQHARVQDGEDIAIACPACTTRGVARLC